MFKMRGLAALVKLGKHGEAGNSNGKANTVYLGTSGSTEFKTLGPFCFPKHCPHPNIEKVPVKCRHVKC